MRAGGGAATALPEEAPAEVTAEGPATNAWWPDAAARLFIVAVALAMAWHTWAHWGSIQVDCGRELYVPLEILRGKLLYRDIWYDYGPLAPYTEATLIAIFGRHLDVFYAFGITLAIACALLLYRIGTVLEGRTVGLTAALILLLCGFGPQLRNFPFPYAYAAPLGLALGLGCAYLTAQFLLQNSLKRLRWAGLTAALAVLCKPEIGAAAYMMLAFAIVGLAFVKHSRRELLRYVAACIPGGLLWIGIYGWFLWKVTPSVLLFENWINTPGTYYARTFGSRMDRLTGMRFDVASMIVVALTAGAALLLWVLIGKAARFKPAALGNSVVALSSVALMCLVAFARYRAPTSQDLSALLLGLLILPFGMVLIAGAFLISKLWAGFRSEFSNRTLAEATFTVFALVLAVRVLAAASPYGYGLFYAAPLLLVFAVVVARLLTAVMHDVEEKRRIHLIQGSLALEILLVAILAVPGASGRTVPFETSWGTVYINPADALGVRQIFEFTLKQKRERHEVVFLPELPMMYAFTGTRAPSKWYSVVPGYVPPSREDAYISDLRRANPAYVLIVTDRTMRVYGVPYFGLDYDRKIYSWIEVHYRVVGQLGNFHREEDAPLAALIYKRRAQMQPASG